jgi:alcohol dehydrogenase class IV
MRDYKAPKLTDEPALPLICIPTTAGTGSEVTRFTIVTDSETEEKMLCVGLAYLPLAAVIDYELTLTAGYRLTADSGIDAFCHAMEAFVSRKRNSFSDGLALSAINRIATSLRRACENPADIIARESMMLAATEAGMAFSNASVTLIHGMSRPIGAMFHIPHGMSNAMLAPVVTNFSLPAAVSRYAQVARAAEFAPLTCTSDEEAASTMAHGLSQLCSDLKVPLISEKVSREKFDNLIPKMAFDALASGSPGNNPLIPTAPQIESLYRDIFSGKSF